MNKNEKNNVILGQDDSLEPRQGACDAAPKANSAESLYTVMPDLIWHLSRIHLLSLRGAAGDVAIPCNKVLSSRGRAESSDVVISCDKVLMNIRNHYCMSHLFSEIATSASRLLAMTIPTLILATILSFSIVSESRAVDSYTYDDDGKVSEIITNDGNTKIAFIRDNSYNYSGSGDPSIFNDIGAGIAVYHKTDDGWARNVFSHASYDSYDFRRLTDGNYVIMTDTAPLYNGNTQNLVVIDKDYKIINEGTYGSYVPFQGSGRQDDRVNPLTNWVNSTSYTYDPETGEKVSQTACTSNSSCITKYFDYDYDDNGNIIAEYLVDEEGAKHGENDTPITTRNYTDNYLAKQAAKNCGKNKSCTSCDGGKVLQGGECVSTCGPSFRLNDGECDRIRYTPAEAAQYLKDTDNEIIMTFKINR